MAQENELLTQAHDEMILAHQAQTGMIQAEAIGIKQPFSLLCIHAQDTLMTMMSELTFCHEFVAMYKLIA